MPRALNQDERARNAGDWAVIDRRPVSIDCVRAAFDVSRARGQNLRPSSRSAHAGESAAAHSRRRVPDAEQLPRPRFLRYQFPPLGISVAKHEFKCVDVPLK